MLQARHWLNLGAYAANVAIVYTASSGAFGDTNTEVSKRYQSLVTPASWAFAIWGLIFASQGLFALVQLTERLRGSALLVDGIGVNYMLACIAQCAWSVTFAQREIWIALVLMCILLACLVKLLVDSDALLPHASRLEYWVLYAPFALHAAWIGVAMLISVNVCVVATAKHDQTAQVGFAIASILLIIIASFAAVFVLERPNPWIPGVAAWALGAIAFELDDPISKINDRFSKGTLGELRDTAVVFSILFTALTIVLIFSKCNECSYVFNGQPSSETHYESPPPAATAFLHTALEPEAFLHTTLEPEEENIA